MLSYTEPQILKIEPSESNMQKLDHEQKRMGMIVIEWLCMMENVNCLNANFDLLKKIQSGQMSWRDINVNFREFVLNYGAFGSENDNEVFVWLEQEMENAENQVTKRKFETALSYSTDPLYAAQVGFGLDLII